MAVFEAFSLHFRGYRCVSMHFSIGRSLEAARFLEDDLETFCATLKSRMTSALCALQPVDEEPALPHVFSLKRL